MCCRLMGPDAVRLRHPILLSGVSSFRLKTSYYFSGGLLAFVWRFCLLQQRRPDSLRHRLCELKQLGQCLCIHLFKETMTSIPGTDSLAWTDEQTRLYLQLRIEEKLKGNIRKQAVNDAGRLSITEKFYETFGERHQWKKFGSKYTTCKKQYEAFKRLTHNRTGLGYDANGFIDMSDDWWNERCKEWPAARKIKEKPVANMDLMETVFGKVYISGGGGWTAQQGEEHLDTMHLDQDNYDDAESRRNIPATQETHVGAKSRGNIPATQETHVGAESRRNIPATQETDVGAESRNGGPSSSSRPKVNRKRSRSLQARQAVADVIRDSVQSRDKILSHKNQLIESHPEFSCSQL